MRSEDDEQKSRALPLGIDLHLDLDKLHAYALSTESLTGKHKARMFRSILDMGAEDADALREQILGGLEAGTVTNTRPTEWGFRYSVDISLTGNNGRVAEADTVWQVEEDGEVLRFTTVRRLKAKRLADDR